MINRSFVKFCSLAISAMIVIGVGTSAFSNKMENANAATWTRVTSVNTITSGGTFVIGYEATANSGIIVPMRTEGSATTSSNGYIYSGITSGSSTSGTLNISTFTTSSSYEFTISAASSSSGAVLIKYGANYIGATSSSGNLRLFASEDTTNKYTNWTPTISGGVVSLTNVGYGTMILQYNSSSPRFSGYSSSQKKLVMFSKSTVTITGITITTQPTNTTYLEGESFSSSGMIVEATYSDASTDPNYTRYSCSPSGPLDSSNTTITVTSLDDPTKTATVSITVTARTLSSISISAQPTTTAYIEGQSFSNVGMIVKATYTDSSENTNYTNYSYSPSGFLATSDTTITITSLDDVTKTATVAITVSPKVLNSISVTTQPTKASYYVGESFSTAGLVITGTYNDSTTSNVTSFCTLSLASGYTFVLGDVGNKTITVSLSPAADVSFSVAVASNNPSTTVIISEVYGGGGNASAPYTNDFIELYNLTAEAIPLGTWSVQYASATGTSWAATNLSGSIPGYGFFLIRGGSSGAVGVALPTIDVTGSTSMSGTAGKVALVNSTAVLSGADPSKGASVIDFVGYGTTANAFEGSGTAPAPSNTTSVQRTTLVDTNSNSADFSAIAPQPRNSSCSFEGFSSQLLSATAVCDPTGATNNVSGTWSTLSTSFADLSSDSQDVLLNATADISGTNVEQAIARYDYIVSKYGYSDFISRVSPTRNFTTLDEGASSLSPIIMISVISLTLVIAYFFLNEKKKENQA